jgi:diketogulonate reductase-like aldo/keto reductase
VTSARWIPSVRRPSKVGKLFKASKDNRLGVDSLDVAFVHDISPDFAYFPNGWEEQYELARKGAFPALSKMRDEGIIRAWGIGVNTPQPILKVMDDADPDVCLCARQYSLIDHADAVRELFPVARKKNVSLVIGSSLNAGFISGSPYNYGKENFKIPAAAIEKREKLRKVAARYGVDLRTAALQFSAAPDVAVALVVGARSHQQIAEDYNSLQAKIPSEFWAELKQQALIESDASLPATPGRHRRAQRGPQRQRHQSAHAVVSVCSSKSYKRGVWPTLAARAEQTGHRADARLFRVQQATRTVPIVFAAAADPVGGGLVASLARPGGNAGVRHFVDRYSTACSHHLSVPSDKSAGRSARFVGNNTHPLR